MGALGRSRPTERPSLRFALSVMGRPVVVETEAPPERARFDELLPALRAVEDAVVDAAVKNVEAEGARVSCAEGCSTCCKRQLVPVTPPEALAIARLVDRLPEPRRSAVRAAFALALEKLKAAGLYDLYMARENDPVRDRSLARSYMALELHCPFLTNDACGIYTDRPLVCRHYLVTSPPELCADPTTNPIVGVPIPFGLPRALMRAMEPRTGEPEHTVPLVLALDYAATRRGELSRKHDSREMLGDLFQALAKRT